MTFDRLSAADESRLHACVAAAQAGRPEDVGYVFEVCYVAVSQMVARYDGRVMPSVRDRMLDAGIGVVDACIAGYDPRRGHAFMAYFSRAARRAMMGVLRGPSPEFFADDVEMRFVGGLSDPCTDALPYFQQVHEAIGGEPVVEAKWMSLLVLRVGARRTGQNRLGRRVHLDHPWADIVRLVSERPVEHIPDPVAHWTDARSDGLCLDEAARARSAASGLTGAGLPPLHWREVVALFATGKTRRGIRAPAPVPPGATPDDIQRVADRFKHWFAERARAIAHAPV